MTKKEPAKQAKGAKAAAKKPATTKGKPAPAAKKTIR
jgi:hypothetical protein